MFWCLITYIIGFVLVCLYLIFWAEVPIRHDGSVKSVDISDLKMIFWLIIIITLIILFSIKN